MTSWTEFFASDPALATEIEVLLHQYGPGMAYLATIRPDGGPRLHPVSPVVTGEGLYCFLIDSPKRRDLQRNGHYALHTYPSEESDDEAYISGQAIPIPFGPLRERIASAYDAAPHVDWQLFEFTVEVAMLAQYRHRGGWPPEYRIWRAPAARKRYNRTRNQYEMASMHSGVSSTPLRSCAE